MIFTNYLDPQYKVYKIRGVVYWVRHQLSGKVKILNRSKILLVDPNICWDEVHKRPTRDPRQGMHLDAMLKRSIQAVPSSTELVHSGGLQPPVPASLTPFPASGNTAQLHTSPG